MTRVKVKGKEGIFFLEITLLVAGEGLVGVRVRLEI